MNVKSGNTVLFSEERIINLINNDGGKVNYYGKIMTPNEANRCYDLLFQNILWENEEVVIFGKHIVTKRKVAWYGDSSCLYTYSNTTKRALAWTKELTPLKQKVEELAGTKYNSCLLNLYHNGEEGMGWHSDDEKEMIKNAAIASLSLGAERRFLFRHKLNKQTISLQLENGSLLVMKGTTQSYWQHSIPKSTRILLPRINLTFRIFKN